MPTPSAQEIAKELQRLRTTGFDLKLASQAGASGFAPEFFFAIASRETNCVNELGDFQADGAHGVGLVQIDIQHPIALAARDDGSWKTNPDPLVAFGAQLLANNIHQAATVFPDLDSDDQLKIAAAGYNCGMSRAISSQRAGDCDLHTTGHDYGADVIARMAIFEQLTAPPAEAPEEGGN
ncbi:hypothetical protein Acid345_2597 [Candidatus Koribacter versatilis Ellin345]|uniref:Transglycosylase SLT domain-containing protein n=1 Tax=Koribacter versatilis (strain Ellin345) TaxID=204669 RepID=Q1INF2_KORVE|nr:hypothetical protein [Candidatus Koribacter versatilis]ABF41598.1 hypothetical protein Acid345_2597 [Candidatus Koribacter versatilis Ellin345]